MLIDAISGDLIAHANACASAERYQQLLVDQLARLAPFDSAVFLPRSPVERTLTVNKSPRHVEVLRRFRVGEAGYLGELERAQAVALRDGAYLDSEVYSLAERRRFGFFNDIIRPQGISSRLVVYVMFRGRVTASVNLCRHGRSPAFQRAHLELGQRIAPLLGLTCAALETRAAAASDGGVLGELEPRERELVQYLRGGYRNKEIARLMQRSPNTVRNQLARVFAKLRVKSRAELAALAERARR